MVTRALTERLVLSTIVLGAGLALIGTALQVREGTDPQAASLTLTVGGLGLVLVSIAASHSLGTVRAISAGDTEYNQLRYWNRLKTVSIFLNLLAILGVATLTVALLVRLGILQEVPNQDISRRLILVLQMILIVNHAYAHFIALHTPLDHRRGPAVTAFLVAGLSVGGVLLVAIAIFIVDPSRLAGYDLQHSDLAWIMLGIVTTLVLTLIGSRALPNLYILVTQEKEFYRGPVYYSRTRSLLVPILVAFSLLFVAILVLLVVGVGTIGLANPVVLAVLGLFLGAALVFVAVSYRFARTKEEVRLYKPKASREQKVQNFVLVLSGLLAFLALVPAGLIYLGRGPPGFGTDRVVDFVALAVLGFCAPLGFYHAARARRIRRLEQRFPDLLRDLAASHRGGLTLTAGVMLAAKGDYDELTPEIRKMADQLSFNTPFSEVLDRLAHRLRTPLVERAVILINEAGRSGGNTTEVLLAAARDAREIKTLESERASNVVLYNFIIYLTFFVFLGFAVLLYQSFVPELIKAAELSQGSAGAGAAGLALEAPDIADYRTFYFCAALVQAIGNGIIGGIMSGGNVMSGLKHAAVLTACTLAVFWLL